MQEQFYSEKQLQSLRIICIMVATSGTLFTILALYLSGGQASDQQTVESITILRVVHTAMTMLVLIVSNVVANQVLAGKRQAVVQSLFQRYQSSVIIRLAMIEGVVLFGAVMFMLAPHEVLQHDAAFHLHLLPVLLLWLQAIKFYPTPEKLEALSQTYQS